MNGYIALAQIKCYNKTHAVGIEKGILDFEYLANALIKHYPDCVYVKMFDNRLDMQGVYYNEAAY
jgi:hypothetical protein